MFLLNSRQSPFTAAQGLTPERPFSRSYGAMLPNSLTEVLPFPLVFSTRLPVLVCGTVTQLWLEAFLDGLGSVASALLQARRHPSAQVVF